MSIKSSEISEAIRDFPTERVADCPRLTVNLLLEVLGRLNQRIDELESELARVSNEVGCLANGINLD